MQAYPTGLKKLDEERELEIRWSDGTTRRYAFSELRNSCPCATCREKRTQEQDQPAELLPVIAPSEAKPLEIVGMRPVGNYAYAISFSDGHDTGIFTLEALQVLGRSA